MKSAIIIPMIFVASVAVAAVPARPVVKNMVYGGVHSDRNISYEPPFQGEFYIGARGALNFMNFSNDQTLYHADGQADNATESFSFRRTLGFGATAGYQFMPRWRMELDYAYGGKFEDADNAGTFDLSAQRIMLNAIYTMAKWDDDASAYLGFGGGIALVESRLSSPYFVDDNKDVQDAVTYATQLILGLEQGLNENFSIAVEYRLGYNGGVTNTRQEADPTLDSYQAKVNGMLANSVTLGLRFKF